MSLPPHSRGRLLAGVAACTLLLSAASFADDAGSYLQSARELEKAHNLRGAEIQLRNAAQAAPGNGAIRLELAKVYLAEGNANAAEAELFAAHTRGIKEEQTAPLMAQAMLAMGAFGDLLKNVPAGNRPAKIESEIRSYRGVAEMSLGENDRAQQMFADAERLDPKSLLALVGETRLLIQQRKLDAAAQKVEQGLKLDPKNGDLLDAKGLVLALRGQTDAALKQYSVALAADPRNLRALLDRASLLAERGSLDAAEKDLQAIRKQMPQSAMAAYLEAVIDSQRGKYKEADALLNTLRGNAGKFPQAYLVSGEVKFKLNQLDQAQEFANRFIAQAGDQPAGYQLLGAIALRRGEVENGIRFLEKAVQLAPRDPTLLGALGEAYLAHGDLDKAKTVLDKAAVLAPNNASIATDRAIAQYASGDRQAAVSALAKLFNGGKGSLLAGPALVARALQLGQLDIAQTAARQLTARQPGDPNYQELFAAVLVQRHDYAGAEKVLRSLLDRNANLASARRDLAQLYVATNRLAQAKQLYQDRLRSKPNDSESLEALANISLRQGNDADAIRLLTQEQNAALQDPGPTLRIIGILGARRKWPEAIALARPLQSRLPNNARVLDTLAQLYWRSGDHPAAAALYKSGIAKFPGDVLVVAHYAGLLTADRNYAAAEPLALRAVQLDPHEPALKLAYVTVVLMARGADAALAASQAVTTGKSGPQAHLMTAAVLEGNNRRADAIALLEKQQAQNPSTLVAVQLASMYQRDKRTERALQVIEPWAARHPDDAEARMAAAQLESAAGKLDQALSQYEWLAVRKPDDPLILNNLAFIYDWKHDPRARPTAEKAARLAPKSASVADTLGWILAEQGDKAGAVKYLAQASAGQPGDAMIQYHYAVALSQTGKTDEARAIVQKLLKQNPSPDAKAAAQTLLAKLGPGH